MSLLLALALPFLFLYCVGQLAVEHVVEFALDVTCEFDRLRDVWRNRNKPKDRGSPRAEGGSH